MMPTYAPSFAELGAPNSFVSAQRQAQALNSWQALWSTGAPSGFADHARRPSLIDWFEKLGAPNSVPLKSATPPFAECELSELGAPNFFLLAGLAACKDHSLAALPTLGGRS